MDKVLETYQSRFGYKNIPKQKNISENIIKSTKGQDIKKFMGCEFLFKAL